MTSPRDRTTTLHDAVEFRDRVANVRPECPCCAVVSRNYVAALSIQEQAWIDHGWEKRSWDASWLLRCNRCRDTRPNAWLAGVDAERLRDWLQRENEKHDYLAFAIDFEDLKRSCT